MTAVAPAGSQVDTDGEVGFIDQVKHPAWRDAEVPTPRVGDRLHVVVLDAIQGDVQTARELRSRNS